VNGKIARTLRRDAKERYSELSGPKGSLEQYYKAGKRAWKAAPKPKQYYIKGTHTNAISE